MAKRRNNRDRDRIAGGRDTPETPRKRKRRRRSNQSAEVYPSGEPKDRDLVAQRGTGQDAPFDISAMIDRVGGAEAGRRYAEAVGGTARERAQRQRQSQPTQQRGRPDYTRLQSDPMPVETSDRDLIARAEGIYGEAIDKARRGDFGDASRMLQGLERSVGDLAARYEGGGGDAEGRMAQRREKALQRLQELQADITGAQQEQMPLMESAQRLGVAPEQLQQQRQEAAAERKLKQAEAKYYLDRGEAARLGAKADITGAEADLIGSRGGAAYDTARAQDVESRRELRERIAKGGDEMTAFIGERPPEPERMTAEDEARLGKLRAEADQIRSEMERMGQRFGPRTEQQIEIIREENRRLMEMLANPQAMGREAESRRPQLLDRLETNTEQLRELVGMSGEGRGDVGSSEYARDPQGRLHRWEDGEWVPVNE